MAKRYRTPEGTLSCTLAELKKQTFIEASEYYIPGFLYVYQGKTYLLANLGLTGKCAVFINVAQGHDRLLVSTSGLGTFLPNVASEGMEITRLCDLPTE